MKKRFVLLILAASILLTTLVGCGKKEETVAALAEALGKH